MTEQVKIYYLGRDFIFNVWFENLEEEVLKCSKAAKTICAISDGDSVIVINLTHGLFFERYCKRTKIEDSFDFNNQVEVDFLKFKELENKSEESFDDLDEGDQLKLLAQFSELLELGEGLEFIKDEYNLWTCTVSESFPKQLPYCINYPSLFQCIREAHKILVT